MSTTRARDDLAALERKANRLRAELADVTERISKIQIYLEIARSYGDDADAPNEAPKTGINVGMDRRPGGRGRDTSISAVAAAIMREHGKPMTIHELLAAFEARDLPIGGANPLVNLSSILSRSPEFQNDRVAGWVLRDRNPSIALPISSEPPSVKSPLAALEIERPDERLHPSTHPSGRTPGQE